MQTVFSDIRSGRSYEVNSDCLDIARRIQTGDGIVWEGDERMHVRFNTGKNRYELWRLGEDNVDRILNSWPPEEWDQRVFLWLVEHDTRKVDVLGDIRKHNDAVEKASRDLCHEVENEAMKFLKWCDDRDIWTNPVSDANKTKLDKVKAETTA